MDLQASAGEAQISTRTTNRAIKAHSGLRGIAATNVAVAHLGLIAAFPNSRLIAFIFPIFLWHNECVDLFFILSGFILHYVYLGKGRVNWGSYAIARIARIAPLYYLTLLFLLALDLYSFVFHRVVDTQLSLGVLLKNLFMVAGLWGNVLATSLNLPSWSVSVEMLLYASLFPLLCFSMSRLPGGRFKAIATVVCITLLAGSYLAPTFKPTSPVERGIFGFTMGFLCCALWREHGEDNAAGRIVCFLACCCAALSITNLIPRSCLIPCFPIIVFLTAADAGIVSRALGHPILLWLGERSYSIYLWHYPMSVFFNRLLIYGHAQADGGYPVSRQISCCILQVIFTGIVSDLSYRFYECPARDLIRRWHAQKFGQSDSVS